MTQPIILSYSDVVDACQDFLGGNATSASISDIHRCVQWAYREVSDIHSWSFLETEGRVHIKAEESSGTITYDHTGGSTYERELTLASGDTWPSWAADASVMIGDVIHTVQTRHSGDQILQLDSVLNPGANVAAGTSFRIFPMWYELPQDFVSFSQPMAEGTLWRFGEAIPFDEMIALHRYRHQTGTLRYHCVRSLPELHGTQGLYLYPSADNDETVDFTYTRTPRQLRHSGHTTNDKAGTITIAGSATTVAGDSTAFSSSMVGALLRTGNATYNPTGLDGLHPFGHQQTISAVTNTVSMTISAALSAAVAASTKYVVSDIIDLDAAVHEVFVACVRKHLSIQRNMKRKEDFMALYKEALSRAKSADSRDTQIKVMSPRQPRLVRLRDLIDVE